MKILKAALYRLEEEKLQAEKDSAESQKSEIAWGSQIRSYVMHPYQLVKDYRGGHETGNVSAVMDGDLDAIIESNLSFFASRAKAE